MLLKLIVKKILVCYDLQEKMNEPNDVQNQTHFQFSIYLRMVIFTGFTFLF